MRRSSSGQKRPHIGHTGRRRHHNSVVAPWLQGGSTTGARQRQHHCTAVPAHKTDPQATTRGCQDHSKTIPYNIARFRFGSNSGSPPPRYLRQARQMGRHRRRDTCVGCVTRGKCVLRGTCERACPRRQGDKCVGCGRRGKRVRRSMRVTCNERDIGVLDPGLWTLDTGLSDDFLLDIPYFMMYYYHSKGTLHQPWD